MSILFLKLCKGSMVFIIYTTNCNIFQGFSYNTSMIKKFVKPSFIFINLKKHGLSFIFVLFAMRSYCVFSG